MLKFVLISNEIVNGDEEVTTECSSFYYLIGNNVEFRPEENLLYSRVNGERITLFVAASRCLQLLLDRQGKLVSQQELFDIGWNNNGVGVSNNTFYQNILMLRKGLKLVGCEQTVIKTVPRQGLTVPSSVMVEKIEGYAPLIPVEEEEALAVEAAKPVIKKKLRLPNPLWVVFFSLASCIGMLLFIIWSVLPSEKPLSNYNYVGKIGLCEVYLYDRGSSLSTYQQFITQNTVDCAVQKFVYFTVHPLLPRASVIRCIHPFVRGKKNTCIPEYQLEWQPAE